MLEGTINYRLMNQYCLDFVHMSYYGDQTHCENHDCVGQLEIDQTACADPGIFVRGVQTKSSDNAFFFFSPQLILQKSNGQFQRNQSFFKVPAGVQHFPGRGGGGPTFSRGGGGPIAYSL